MSCWTVVKTLATCQTSLVCSAFRQEEEGGVCPEVLHSQAGCQRPRLARAQREGPADGARHAPAALHPHPAARRDPHPVEGRNRHSAVRSLKVAPFPRTSRVCVQSRHLLVLCNTRTAKKEMEIITGIWDQKKEEKKTMIMMFFALCNRVRSATRLVSAFSENSNY